MIRTPMVGMVNRVNRVNESALSVSLFLLPLVMSLFSYIWYLLIFLPHYCFLELVLVLNMCKNENHNNMQSPIQQLYQTYKYSFIGYSIALYVALLSLPVQWHTGLVHNKDIPRVTHTTNKRVCQRNKTFVE